MASKLLITFRKEFKKIADPQRAPRMQAYMKSKMPYHGVSAPFVREVCKKVLSESELNFSTAKEWQREVLDLWHEAKFREERYAAMALAAHKQARSFQTPKALKMYEEMIVSGAWWDFIDPIAAHRVGEILKNYPKPMKAKMLNWSRSSNMWKRRTSIICQLDFKEETDLDLLYACIEPSLGSKEFFLRKAIGWALRQYAWTNPKEIRRYVKKNKKRLSPLSVREALKNIS
jgi:3-methyladenine DNA glycosylase AlkD